MKKEQPKKLRSGSQQQEPPGLQSKMKPHPQIETASKGSHKLEGKIAVITGGDSGIGQAVAAAFAKEGADVAVIYLNEHTDAQVTKQLVEKHGRKCLLLRGDVSDEKFCQTAVESIVHHFGKLDILVNNAAEQHPQEALTLISEEQLEKTFRTNIFAYFFMAKACLKYLEKSQGKIINTSSVTAYRGSKHLLDYSSTKGAIISFTRSLALALADKNIRVNAVAPGPVWTPLIVSTFPPEKIATFGSDVPMKRAGEPAEIAPCFVFLASDDASFMTGQVLHPNGGEIVNT